MDWRVTVTETVTEPIEGNGARAAAARDLIATCERELERTTDPLRAAQLHHEIGDALEHGVGDLAGARARYAQALTANPEQVASLRGARRVDLARGRIADALPLFDNEIRVTPRPRDRAWLHYQRGRLLEDTQGDLAAARQAYASAIELDPDHPTLVGAALRCARRARDWPAVAGLLERLANAVQGDERLRAALVAERARLVETRLDDNGPAAELYETALRIDPDVDEALPALARLYGERGDWTGLLAALDRAAAHAADGPARAQLLYRAARIHSARLGDRAAAIALLERAHEQAPDQRSILEELARLHQDARDHAALARVLRELVTVTDEAADRVALLHTLGQVLEAEPEQEAEAVACYRQALGLSPGHVPVLQALGTLLARRKDWHGLIDMHLAEAEAVTDTARRAAAHMRVAETYEVRLQRPVPAATHYAQALALAPGHPAAFKALVRLYAQAGEHRRLIELHERAVDEALTVERKVVYLFKIGALWEDSVGDPVQAASVYKRILALRDDDLGAIHALQRVHERAGRYSELVDCLVREAELATDTELIIGLRHRAAVVVDEHLGDAAAARRLLLQVLELDPGFVPALTSLGRIYYRTGQWHELVAMYQRELDFTPDAAGRAALSTKIGELCEQRLGATADAIQHHRDALLADPGYRPALRALIRLLEAQGSWDEVALVLEQHVPLVSSPASRAHLLYRVAEIYAEALDHPRRAIDLCRRALAEDPDHAPALALLERLLHQTSAWPDLAAHLAHEATRSTVMPARAAFELRRGQLWRDRLDQDDTARAAFEAARAAGAGLGALLPLEPLYAADDEWDAAAGCAAAVADEVGDVGARLAALREAMRAREADTSDGRPAGVEALRRACEAMLAVDPGAVDALECLAALGERIGDRGLIATSYGELGRLAADPGLAAQHRLRRAEALEAAGDPEAREAYRAVLAVAPSSLAAVRGLGRVGAATGDAGARADACVAEAALTTRSERAGALLVAAADLHRGPLGDAAGAVAILESALERSPDSEPAATRLGELLRGSGERPRLIDVLARTAGAASSPERQAALWRAVAALYAEGDDAGAAMAALKRGLAAAPDDAGCIQALAQLYARGDRWTEAIATLDRLATADKEPGVRAAAFVEQAKLWGGRLGRPDQARAKVDAALVLAPDNHDARRLLVQLDLGAGALDPAGTVAQDLLADAATDAERTEALLLVASVERARGDAAVAERALSEAVYLEGPGGEAHRRLHAVVAESGHWHALAAALTSYVQRGSEVGRVVEAYLALADVYGDAMRLPGQAVTALDTGLAATGDPRLATALVARLGRAGDPEAALRHARALVDQAPEQPSSWRALADLLRVLDRPGDARRALMGLDALGVADDADRRILYAGSPGLVARGFGADELNALSVAGITSSPAAEVLAAVGDGLARYVERAPAPSRRDKLPAGHPVRGLADRLAEAVGVECEVHERAGAQPVVQVALAEPVTVVVSDRLQTMPPTTQAFLLARPLALAVAGLHPVLTLSARELGPIFAAAQTLAAGASSAQAETLRKAVPRKLRKSFELAVGGYGAAPVRDAGRWRDAVVQTATRAAALLVDDLVAAIRALILTEDVAPPSNPMRVVSPEIADLLRFWMSEPAVRVRQNLGLR